MRPRLIVNIIGCVIILLSTPIVVYARSTLKDIGGQFREAGEVAFGGQPPSLQVTAANIIRGGLGLLGIVFVGFIVYAGVLWMTAGGEDKKVTKAKETITSAIIGLAITVGAYAITNFVITSLVTATG